MNPLHYLFILLLRYVVVFDKFCIVSGSTNYYREPLGSLSRFLIICGNWFTIRLQKYLFFLLILLIQDYLNFSYIMSLLEVQRIVDLTVLRLADASGWSILPRWITEGSLSYYLGSLVQILVHLYPLQY